VRQMRTRRRGALGALTAVAIGLTTAAAGPVLATTDADRPATPGPLKPSDEQRLGEHDEELLAEAVARGDRRVTVLIATDVGEAEAVAARVRRLGGMVGKRFDRVGYVRASVPTSAVTRTAALPGVDAVDLNDIVELPDPRPVGAEGSAAAQVASPGPGTPAANPFMPTYETGAVRFKQHHPTWDGRGITIGVVDTGVDLDHPALQTTTTAERKVVDWVTATDPIVDNDGTWVAMRTEVTGPKFTAFGATWTAPPGTFRVNRFAESITAGSEVGGDVNRDGDTTDRFGVLYDAQTHDIWVDANQNFDFTDDGSMRPYKENHEIGRFGVDNPATRVQESMPFVVEFRVDLQLTPTERADFVNIGIVQAAHGSHVAGITAANDLLGNPVFDGAAPGAKIVSSRACSWGGGCTFVALTEGMMDLVVNRDVDVVNMSIGGLLPLNDGSNARAQLYNRLISDYGVQLFLSAGNSGPGLNTVGDPSVATYVVSVGAAVSKQTWLANYGSVVSAAMNMFNFASRGPREDGGFKPNVTAPGSAISSIPLWQAGQPVPEAGYELPPGYAMFNGTSMSSPQAAGAAALLLSAGLATGTAITPAQLRRALYSTADYNGTVPAYAQGNGQVDVNGAWSLLRRDVATRGYQIAAPVCTPLSEFLATPHQGGGVYNRCAAAAGGHRPGQSKTYDVAITRTSGPAGNLRHDIRWIGNDGTFSGPSQVRLPLNTARTIKVRARPGVGAHGAIMRLDDPMSSGVDVELMHVVVASNELTAPSFAFSTSEQVERNRTHTFFVGVPGGTKALQVNLSGIATGSQTRFIVIDPYGVPVESTSSLVCYTNFSDPKACNPVSRSYTDPLPGVWEIEVESRRTTPFLNNPFSLTAQAQGVAVEQPTIVLPSAVAGQPTPVTWTLRNEFGPVTVTAPGGPLSSARVDRPSIAHQETQTFHVDVPAGATKLKVVIGDVSDAGADLDLSVLKGGQVVGISADGDSEEAVTLVDPAPGTYDIEVFGYDVPRGTTRYDYRDAFFAAALGSLSMRETPVTLPSGGTAQVSGTVVANVAPAAGRHLAGEMTVVTSEGAVVGRGLVVIQSVSG